MGTYEGTYEEIYEKLMRELVQARSQGVQRCNYTPPIEKNSTISIGNKVIENEFFLLMKTTNFIISCTINSYYIFKNKIIFRDI